MVQKKDFSIILSILYFPSRDFTLFITENSEGVRRRVTRAQFNKREKQRTTCSREDFDARREKFERTNRNAQREGETRR